MAIYCKIPGLKGNVTDKNYAGWIHIDSLDLGGVNKNIAMTVGRDNYHNNTTPRFHQVVLTKQMDESSIGFYQHAFNSVTLAQVEFHYVQTGNPNFTFAKILLKNVMVTGYSDWRSGNTQPEELVRLAYQQIERTFIPRNNGKPQSPLITGYNLSEARQM